MPNLKTGAKVVLDVLPPGLINGLPVEDQLAIKAIIGQPVTLGGYSFGQAEVVFIDHEGAEHTIWVEPNLLRSAAAPKPTVATATLQAPKRSPAKI